LTDGRLQRGFSGQHPIAALAAGKPGQAKTIVIVLEQPLDADLPDGDAITHWTPTLAASVANAAAALPPKTSMRAGRSPGAKRASASVDGGRNKTASRRHWRNEAGRHSRLGAALRRSWCIGYPIRKQRMQCRGGGRGGELLAKRLVAEHLREFRQQLKVFLGGVFRHQQHEY